jgi:Cdc6-like AAA superfamily ATPase
MKPKITQIENAFQPAKEIDAAEKFAGRRNVVEDAYLGLIASGAHIAIVGNRGIGKTSLARQLVNIATGHNDLLKKLNIPHDRRLDFLAVYFACGSTTKNTIDLLERLLTSNGALAEWIYDVPKASKIVRAYEPKFGANIGVAQVSFGAKRETETTIEPAITSHAIDSVFTNAVAAIVEQKVATDGVLIVVDEFDQINDPSGFASFLKAISTNVPKVKFCIVGVAQDVQFLLKEHMSSDRLFAGTIISVPKMNADELCQIVHIAEQSIDNYITFDGPGIDRVASLAQGHPYMVHLVGKYALRSAYSQDRQIITSMDVEATLRSIAERGADPVLEGRYKKAVGLSEQRETVLKALADCQSDDGEVFTTAAYKVALDQGVDNASQYVGQLVTDEYGSELEKLRERYYRFHDSLFAAYVRARPRLVQRVVSGAQ